MTSQGWQNISKITQDDLIACRIGNKVEYHHPQKLRCERNRTDILSFKSTQLDLEVTSDHILWVHIQKGPHRLYRADRFIDRKTDLYFKKTFPHMDGPEFDVVKIPARKTKTHNLPAYYLNGPAFMQFLGWIFSDGHVISNRVEITQTKHLMEVHEALQVLGMKYKVKPHFSQKAQNWNGRRFKIHSVQLAEVIRSYFNHGFPYSVKNSSKRFIGLFLRAFFYGNGDFHGQRRLYVRLNKKLADDIQELVQKYGYSSNLRRVGNMYVVTIGKDKVHCLETHRCPIKQIPESRDVYECKIPGGLIFIRRNGKCCWIGN